jgi:hypothetical protein
VTGPYDDVPDGRDAVEVDPHWQDLQRLPPGALPTSYLPPTVSGQVHGWRRGAVWVVLVMLVSATAGGVCLTYGPGELFALFRNT